MTLLEDVTALSHEFGRADYVRGGGGNTSVKNSDILWVKPSGIALADMTVDGFVAMDRSGLRELFDASIPEEPSPREAMVKEIMVSSVRADSSGRPSVEAPLHEIFSATFVVHTHPALVNGMTCAAEGRKACQRLFPQALWVDYIDPGYALCMHVRGQIASYVRNRGHDPDVIFLQNHGVFVGGNSPGEIRSHYTLIAERLRNEYARGGVATQLQTAAAPSPLRTKSIQKQLRKAMGKDAEFLCAAGPFNAAAGPVSPDHIVYAKSYPLLGEPCESAVGAYRDKHGYPPRVVSCSVGVFGLGQADRQAHLALEFAQDAGLVRQLAEAFGGIQYLCKRASRFIENWEAEAYRRWQQV